jgi:hypothetical protein
VRRSAAIVILDATRSGNENVCVMVAFIESKLDLAKTRGISEICGPIRCVSEKVSARLKT